MKLSKKIVHTQVGISTGDQYRDCNRCCVCEKRNCTQVGISTGDQYCDCNRRWWICKAAIRSPPWCRQLFWGCVGSGCAGLGKKRYEFILCNVWIHTLTSPHTSRQHIIIAPTNWGAFGCPDQLGCVWLPWRNTPTCICGLMTGLRWWKVSFARRPVERVSWRRYPNLQLSFFCLFC